MLCYVDASALVKLIVEEAESQALRSYVFEDATIVSSRLAAVEVLRAINRKTYVSAADAAHLLSSVEFVELDAAISRLAGPLPPPALRSLDAIHVATALQVDVDAFVTYDVRLAEAARLHGLPVVSPR